MESEQNGGAKKINNTGKLARSEKKRVFDGKRGGRTKINIIYRELTKEGTNNKINRIKKPAQSAWEPGGGEKYDISVRLNFFRIPILRKAPKYLMVLPVRARLATARARLGFSQFSEYPNVQFYDFPIFKFSDYLIFQLSDSPIFRISDFPIFQISEFSKIRFSGFPIF